MGYISREDAIETLAEYFNSFVDFVGNGTIKKNTIEECINRLDMLEEIAKTIIADNKGFTDVVITNLIPLED